MNSISSYIPSDGSYGQNFEPDYTVARGNQYDKNPLAEADLPLGDGASVVPGMGVDTWRSDDDNMKGRFFQNPKAQSYFQTDEDAPRKGTQNNAESRQADESKSGSGSGGMCFNVARLVLDVS